MKHLFLLTILLFSQRLYALEECRLYPMPTGLDRLSELAKSHPCKVVDKTTWEPDWNSPCDCLRAKDISTIINVKYKENEEKFDKIKEENASRLAGILKQQLYKQFEAALRMDVYLKKGLISTETINRKNSGSNNPNISMPLACRFNKVEDILGNTNNPKKCNPELKNKRLKLIFGSSNSGADGKESFNLWKKETNKLFANAALNKLSQEDRDNGMCLPYKSYLSLNNSNPMRSSYVRLAKDLGNFEAFQNWVKDPKQPIDGVTLAAVKTPNIDHRGIMRLIKSDPIFERMSKDPKFYEQIIANKSEVINESDEDIMRAMSDSQNRDCERMFGKDDEKETKEGILTQFLCQEDFPKDFMADRFIDINGDRFQKKLGLKEKDEAQNMLSYYFYCSEKNKKPEENGNILEILGDKDLPEKDFGTEAILNPILTPISDLAMSTKDLEKSSETKMYANLNYQVCKYVPDHCKDPKTLSSETCAISKVSQATIFKMLENQIKDPEDLKMIGGFFSIPSLSEEKLRKELLSYKFSEEEILALITLREQLPAIVRYRNEAELRSYLGVETNFVLDDKFYKSDKFLKNPNIPYDLKQRILNKEKVLTTDNLSEEKESDASSSLFANYYALASIYDETYLNGSAEKIDPATRRPISGMGSGDGSNVKVYEKQSFNSSSGSAGDMTKVPEPPKKSAGENRDDIAVQPRPDETIRPGDPVVSTTPTTPKHSEDKKKENPVASLTSSESTQSSSGGSTSSMLSSNSGSNKKKAISNSSKNKEIEERLNELDNFSLDDRKDEVVKEKSIQENSEIAALQKELSREKVRLKDSNKNAATNTSQARAITPFGGSYGSNARSSGYNNNSNNSNVSSDNLNYANPYDPMDRAVTGKREIASGAGAAGAGSASGGSGASGGGSSPHLSSSGAAEEGSEGLEEAGPGATSAKKKTGRFPAQENGESDPDDVCGYEQEMKCVIEFATIESLSPSIASFVESLQFQGRSFKAVEIYKYKNNRKPARYYIYSFGPSLDLSKEEKEKLFKKVQELSKDANKNRDQLKELSKKTMVLKKTEITKEEAIKLSGTILKLEDINKLSDRRANKS